MNLTQLIQQDQGMNHSTTVHTVDILELSLQCFDTVGLSQACLSGEVLAWLSVWSEVQMICIWSS